MLLTLPHPIPLYRPSIVPYIHGLKSTLPVEQDFYRSESAGQSPEFKFTSSPTHSRYKPHATTDDRSKKCHQRRH